MNDQTQELRPSGLLRFAEGRQLDFRGHASSIASRALTTVYRRMLCLIYPLQNRTIPIYRPQIDIDFRTLQSEEIGAYLRFRPTAVKEVLARRMAQGDRCHASWHEGEIVDACWIATGTAYVQYLDRFIALERGDVYSYDAYTLPGFRGYGIFMARNSYTARRNQREGCQRSVALVAPENYASWLILARSGLETIGEYSVIRFPFGAIHRQRALPGRSLPALSPTSRGHDPRKGSTRVPGEVA
jgi:hypothetical protein